MPTGRCRAPSSPCRRRRSCSRSPCRGRRCGIERNGRQRAGFSCRRRGAGPAKRARRRTRGQPTRDSPARARERRVVARSAPPAARAGFAAQQNELAAKPGTPLAPAASAALKPAAPVPAPNVVVAAPPQAAPPTARPPANAPDGKPSARDRRDDRTTDGERQRDRERGAKGDQAGKGGQPAKPGQHRLRLKLRLYSLKLRLHSPHRPRNQNLSPFRRKRRHPKLRRLHPRRRRRGMNGEQKASVNAIENRAEARDQARQGRSACETWGNTACASSCACTARTGRAIKTCPRSAASDATPSCAGCTRGAAAAG